MAPTHIKSASINDATWSRGMPVEPKQSLWFKKKTSNRRWADQRRIEDRTNRVYSREIKKLSEKEETSHAFLATPLNSMEEQGNPIKDLPLLTGEGIKERKGDDLLTEIKALSKKKANLMQQGNNFDSICFVDFQLACLRHIAKHSSYNESLNNSP